MMDVKEQEKSYSAFLALMTRGVIITIVGLVIIAFLTL